MDKSGERKGKKSVMALTVISALRSLKQEDYTESKLACATQ